MTDVVLYPDVQFDGAPTIEQQCFGEGFELRVSQKGDLAAFNELDFSTAVGLVCYHEIEITKAVLDRLPRLRVVVRAGVGYDNIDIEAAGAAGVAVCNTPDYGTTDVADHAIAMTLALTRGIVRYNDAIRADPVNGWNFKLGTTVRRTSTLVFGIVGLGRIGTATALRAKALGMRVVFFDPNVETGRELAVGVERAGTLEDLLHLADIVSLHAPLNETTRGMLSEAAFANFKPGAFLVNTARGGMVDLIALGEALRSGKVGAAALDVAELEPLTPTHPLMSAWQANEFNLQERLIFSPHSAFYSPSSLIDLRTKSAVTAANYLRTGQSPDLINREFMNSAAALQRVSGGGSK